MSAALKRKRASSSSSSSSDMALRVNPPLPTLSPDGVLTVYTHPSIAQYGMTDYSRFQIMGDVALHYCVGRLIWKRDEGMRTKAYQEELSTLLSDENLADWARQYKLRDRLRYGAEVAASIDKSTELANLFRAYAGAVDWELGPMALIQWIENLINIPYSPDAPQPSTPIPSATPPVKSGVYSALLNESAQRGHHKLDFKSDSTGPSHNLVWTMRVLVDGTEQGVGSGTSKAAAKEDAARKACHQMGWKV